MAIKLITTVRKPETEYGGNCQLCHSYVSACKSDGETGGYSIPGETVSWVNIVCPNCNETMTIKTDEEHKIKK